MQQKSWIVELLDAEDNSGDVILQFPDELIQEKGWKEGAELLLTVEETPTGNVLIITEKN